MSLRLSKLPKNDIIETGKIKMTNKSIYANFNLFSDTIKKIQIIQVFWKYFSTGTTVVISIGLDALQMNIGNRPSAAYLGHLEALDNTVSLRSSCDSRICQETNLHP